MSGISRSAYANMILQRPDGVQSLAARASALYDDEGYDWRTSFADALEEATKLLAAPAVASVVEFDEPPVPDGDNSSLL